MVGKKILLCVTGGIASYKAVSLTSKLVQAGADVRVIMSEGAQKFISPLTFSVLSKNEVYTDTFDEKDPKVIAHIDLGAWADLVIIAPATANTIGKLANGIADNMITSTLLANKKPVFIAPAMNVNMYEHPAVLKNLETCVQFGYQLIEPSEGYLACGYIGKGRLEEPETIVRLVEEFFEQKNDQPLLGKNVLVTAGPTREKIDPVRFLTNYSSGKMGYAIAEQAKKLGANVTLISGPVSIAPPKGVTICSVESAAQMYEEVLKAYPTADYVFKTAAVADYRPKVIFNEKMKKQPGEKVLELERTQDILLELGKRKTGQFLVGFAAETNNVQEYAIKKLDSKNLDMIVANNIATKNAGFGVDTNIVSIFKRDGSRQDYPLMTKQEVAKEIIMQAMTIKKRITNE